jgi:hypothetical protein
MPLSKNKGSDGKVNYENIQGRALSRRTISAGTIPSLSKRTSTSPSLRAPGYGLQPALSGSTPRKSGRGGRGPTLNPLG